MKKLNKKSLFVLLLIILLILKLIFVDKDVLSIILSSAFLGFYLIAFINYFRKKETKLEKNYLKIILFLLVFAYFIQTGILLFSGKNIVLSLYYVVSLWMMLDSSNKLLNKKDYEAKKIFVSAVLIYILPFFRHINLELVANLLIYLLIAIYFNGCRENYFGLFDKSLVRKRSDKFKWTQWIKTMVLIMNGIVYLLWPILGGVIALVNGLLCYGRFFDKLVAVYEQKLFSKKLRRDKEFIACMEVYSLAPSVDNYLKNRLELVAKETFLEVGTPKEVYVLMELSSARKFEHIKELVFENDEMLLKQMNDLFKKKTRPEVICKLLSTVYVDKKKIVSKLDKMTNEFNDKYIKLVEQKKNMLEKVENIKELYKKYCLDVEELISKESR